MKKKLTFMIVSGLVAIAFILTPWVYKHTTNKKNTISNNIELEKDFKKELHPEQNSSEKNVETASNNSKETTISNEKDVSKNQISKDSFEKNTNNKQINPIVKDAKTTKDKVINNTSNTSSKKIKSSSKNNTKVVTYPKNINNKKANSIKNSKTCNVKQGKTNTQAKTNNKKLTPVTKAVVNNSKKISQNAQCKGNCVKKETPVQPKINFNNQNKSVVQPTSCAKKTESKIQPNDINNKKTKKVDVNNDNKQNVTTIPSSTSKKNDHSNDSKVIKSKKTEPSLDEIQQAIFKIVNRERINAGKAPLSYDKTMEKYAIMKSKDMITRNYFEHVDPECKLITEKMKNDGVRYMAWGENIIYRKGQLDVNKLAEQFMESWMNSPGHRANILSDKFKTIGVGLYRIGDAVYGTQEFCKY